MKKIIATLVLLFAISAEAGESDRKSIYFGDLHTHTNLSGDAVLQQTVQGVNRGPEAVCLYAKACAQVDFFGFSDHAEMLNKEGWDRIQQASEACNTTWSGATETDDPEMVAFTGFEWTAGAVRKYWGHKNVFFRNGTVPDHPLGAYTIGEMNLVGIKPIWTTMGIYKKFDVPAGLGINAALKAAKVNAFGRCDDEYTDGCVMVGEEPKDLFAYLDANKRKFGTKSDPAGFDAIVIPHGTAWGMAKVGTDWDIQINNVQHDPEYQRVIEVYSGHGNSEEYRDFENGEGGYETCRVRAGRLAWAHCKKNGGHIDACREEAKAAAAKGDVDFVTSAKDWGYCDECPDCFLPAEKYQHNGSVQAALAKTGFTDKQPVNYTFGFIASTDDHAARPASVMEGAKMADWPMAYLAQAAIQGGFSMSGRNAVEAERVGSYFSPGGLVAIHAENRSREALFDALQRREVYGTSGPRIQLWFDAVAGTGEGEQRLPMGSEIATQQSPRFVVEAWGGPRELAGCSEATRAQFGDDVVKNECLNHCFNPANDRIGIDKIEVIKITPQISPDEKIRMLIQDPWLVIPNSQRERSGEPSPVFKAEFTDPDYADGTRNALYYVRAIQAPTPMVNATPLRDEDKLRICDPGVKSWNCLTEGQERAWSSPIYLQYR